MSAEEERSILDRLSAVKDDAGKLAARYENEVLGSVPLNGSDLAFIHRGLEMLAEAVAKHEQTYAANDARFSPERSDALAAPVKIPNDQEPGPGNPAAAPAE
jgi:hypothetical protein